MWDIDDPEAGEAVIPVNSFVGLRGAGHLVTVYDVVIRAAPASVGLGAARVLLAGLLGDSTVRLLGFKLQT